MITVIISVSLVLGLFLLYSGQEKGEMDWRDHKFSTQKESGFNGTSTVKQL